MFHASMINILKIYQISKLVPLITLDLQQISSFNFIEKTMELTHLTLFSITFKEESHSVTGNFHVQSKSFINGSMGGKLQIQMINAESKMSSK